MRVRVMNASSSCCYRRRHSVYFAYYLAFLPAAYRQP